jgi:hypothetical protein
MSEQNQEIVPTDESQVSILEAVNRAEIDIQIATAHQYPRQLEAALNRMIAAVCHSVDTAAECKYVMPGGRNGKSIEGPSIRLAEIVAMNYGNLRIQTRPPVIKHSSVHVEWAAHDLESNYATTGCESASIMYSPKGGKKGKRFSQDMINMTCRAVTAKARRNGVFAVVPGVLVKQLLVHAQTTITGSGKPLAAKREIAMSYFKKDGVSDERILRALGRDSVDELTEDDILTLHGIATAVKDGSTSLAEAFPKQTIADKVNAELKEQKNGKQPDDIILGDSLRTEPSEPGYVGD